MVGGDCRRQILPFDAGIAGRRADYLQRAGRLASTVGLRRQLIELDPPRRTHHRLELARALAVEDRSAAKSAVLALLEEMPHYWQAQKLLLDIVETEAEAQ